MITTTAATSESQNDSPTPLRGRRLLLAWMPWLLLALAVVLGAIAIFFLLVNQEGAGREPIESLYGDMLYLFSAIVGAAVGALIIARRQRNPIGWLLIWVGLVQVAVDVCAGYSTYGLITQPGALPGVVFFGWLAQWLWTLPFGALVLILLVYPTGQLLSPRWRIVAWAGILGVAALLLTGALSPELTVGNGQPPLTIPNPIGVLDAQSIFQPILFLLFAFVLVVIFGALLSLIIRFRRASGDERQQLKWFTYAAALAVTMVPVANLVFGAWAQAVQNLAFLMLPLAVGVAILKYRLYDIDLLINRTLVYIPLTAILAGIFAASITLSQKLFVAITGATSDAATVLTTLIVVAVFDPLKLALQNFVDKRFKEAPDPARKLNALSDQMRAVLQVMDVEQMTRRVLEEAVTAFGAGGGAILRGLDGTNPIQTFGEWNGDARLSVPLEDNGTTIGRLALGARRNGADYSAQDRAALLQIAHLTARAMAIDERANGVSQ